MARLDRIADMTIMDAVDLRDRAVAGDREAARDFVLFALWRRVRSSEEVSEHRKRAVFKRMAKSIRVNVEAA
jgi:hypothetical protein